MGDRVLADSTTLEQCSAGCSDVAHSPGGARLATASSIGSGVVAVYDGGSGSPLWSLSGRFSLPRGARPTKLAWSHPEFGQALAVAADDGTVGVWIEEGGVRVSENGKKTQQQEKQRLWQRAASFESGSRGAALALAFAPAVHGPRLAVGWGDGVVRVYVARSLLLGCAVSKRGATSSSLPLPPPAAWELESQFEASPPASPVTSLCWRPHYAGGTGEKLPPLLAVGTAARKQQQQQRGAGGIGGRDSSSEGGGSGVWLFRTPLLRWTRACTLDASGDVSAVAWAPAGSAAAPEKVATAIGERVRVFALAGAADALVSASASSASASASASASSSNASPVPPEAVLRHSARVWRLEWAPLGGGWLAAGTERGAVALWRQDLRGVWGAQSAITCEGEAQRGDPQQDRDAASGLATVVV